MTNKGQFDDGNYIQKSINGFWTQLFQGREFVHDLIRAFVFGERQLQSNIGEFLDAQSYQRCPVLHKENVLPIFLTGDNVEEFNWSIFGDSDFVFGNSSEVYGGTNNGYRIVLPANIQEIRFLTDSPVQPTFILSEGVDFVFAKDDQNSFLLFAEDPRRLFDEDQPKVLFAEYVLVNQNFYTNQYGPLVSDKPLRNDTTVVDVIKQLIGAFIHGTSLQSIVQLVEVLTDKPIGRDCTIEEIGEDGDHFIVVTPDNVFVLPKETTHVIVDEGDFVPYGEPITHEVRIISPRTDETLSSVPVIALGPGLLHPDVPGPIFLENEYFPIQVFENVNGKTKIVFPVGGTNAAQTAFFDTMHAAGVADGKTLANYLDKRENPQTEPTAVNLPQKVNPLRLIVGNTFANNALFVEVNQPSADVSKKLAYSWSILAARNPHGIIHFLVNGQERQDNAEMTGDGNEHNPGYSEQYNITTS